MSVRRRVFVGGAMSVLFSPTVSMANVGQYQVMRGAADDLKIRLRSTMRFVAGSNRSREVIYVADPRCGFCHRAWAVMRPYVARGDIALDVILLGLIRGSEEIAVSVLNQPDPGAAWMAGQASTANAQVPPPPPPRGSPEYQRALGGLRANLDFARGIGLQGTPWTAFIHGEDVYHLVGAGDVDGFLRHVMSLG